MAFEALREAIEAEGRARIDAILGSAREEADRLRDAAIDEVRRRKEEALHALEVELRREADARIAIARIESRERALAARAAVVDRVLALARQRAAAEVASPSLREAWIELAEGALAHLPGDEDVVFACSAALAPVVESALSTRDGVRVEVDPDLGAGFRASGSRGEVVVEATLDTLFDDDRSLLAIGIVRQLDAEREA